MNISLLKEEIDNYLVKYKKFMTKDIYITVKMYDTFTAKYKYLYDECYLNRSYLKDDKSYENILKIIQDKNKLLKKHNRKYVDDKLVKYKDYFDNMFIDIDKNIILDKEQREAIICDEDNLLILSGAGSGKTTTIVGKVKYLIDIKRVSPKSIAVVTFAKKAKEELEDRINNKMNLNVDIYTFHSLGLKIIRNYDNRVCDIIEDNGKYKIISDYIKNILFKDKEKFTLFFDVFKDKTKFNEEYKLFNNYSDYHNYMYKRKYITENKTMDDYIKEQSLRRKSYLRTLNGEYCKSKEEVDIANFLYLNSIEYEYEKQFKKLDNSSIYKPDFYIEQNNNYNYIEHFGIDRVSQTNNRYTKKELENYLKNMNLKLDFHKREKVDNLFIITHSKVDGKTGYLEILKDNLEKKGYVLKRRSNEEIYERLKQTSEDRYIVDFINRIVIPFISYFKKTDYFISDLDSFKIEDDIILNKQIDVMKDLLINYQNELEKNNLIDFEDMINIAYKIIPKVQEKNIGVDYKYIIIDEYQDVSMQRFNLTKRISKLFSSKIIAVGDDYQSIFGFSGSRIDLMTEFKSYLEDAKQIPITNVFRFSQELIDIAADFINKNNNQIKKKLSSVKRLDNPVEIFIYDDSDYLETNANKSILVDEIIDKIYEKDNSSKVLLLERYNNDIDSILYNNLFVKKNNESIINKKHNDMKIDYLTIHKSKGLEYDNCILINAIDNKYGFPSKIEDEKIIRILKPKINESVEYPEERRLFYVALTRTKNKLYIVCPSSKVSKFVKEISIYKNVIVHK